MIWGFGFKVKLGCRVYNYKGESIEHQIGTGSLEGYTSYSQCVPYNYRIRVLIREDIRNSTKLRKRPLCPLLMVPSEAKY